MVNQFIKKEQVENLITKSNTVLKEYINRSAQLKAENTQLSTDINKLKTVLKSINQGSISESSKDQNLLFNKAEEEYERLIIEHAKNLKNSEVDDLLASLGFS